MRELNPSGFLAPSSILLSRLLFILVVVTGTLSEFGFGSKLQDPGKLVGRVTLQNFLHWHQSHNDSEAGVEVGLKLFSAALLHERT